MPSNEYELADAELEVLKALWEKQPATVRELLERLAQRGRTWAYTTVQTFLTRLEQKGFVRSDRSGAAFSYSSAVTRDQVIRSRLKSMVSQLFDGAAGELVLQLVRQERLSPSEVAELQNLIEKLDGDAPSAKGRRRT